MAQVWLDICVFLCNDWVFASLFIMTGCLFVMASWFVQNNCNHKNTPGANYKDVFGNLHEIPGKFLTDTLRNKVDIFVDFSDKNLCYEVYDANVGMSKHTGTIFCLNLVVWHFNDVVPTERLKYAVFRTCSPSKCLFKYFYEWQLNKILVWFFVNWLNCLYIHKTVGSTAMKGAAPASVKSWICCDNFLGTIHHYMIL